MILTIMNQPDPVVVRGGFRSEGPGEGVPRWEICAGGMRSVGGFSSNGPDVMP
jgi:hypothetical protein